LDCRLELEDGSGFLVLEDGTGFLLIEQCTPALIPVGGGFGEEFRPSEDPAGVVVALVLAVRRRRRRWVRVG